MRTVFRGAIIGHVWAALISFAMDLSIISFVALARCETDSIFPEGLAHFCPKASVPDGRRLEQVAEERFFFSPLTWLELIACFLKLVASCYY